MYEGHLHKTMGSGPIIMEHLYRVAGVHVLPLAHVVLVYCARDSDWIRIVFRNEIPNYSTCLLMVG